MRRRTISLGAPWSALALALLAAASVAPPARAQQQQPPPAAPAASAGQLTRLLGTAYDSVHSVMLVGATVRVRSTTGSTREGVTGEDGHFVVDSIPPGDATVQLLHPMLDTLGITLTTPALTFPAPPGATLDLATPSEETLVGMFCAPAWRARGPGVLAGRILDADTDEPAVGTKVSIAWFETTVSTTEGIRRVPRVREGTVGKDGTYRICGLPGELEGTVQAQRGSVRTAEVKVSFVGHALAMVGLKIGSEATVVVVDDSTAAAAAPGDSARARARRQTTAVQGPLVRGNAVVTGRVLNAAGAPVVGARVDIQGTAAAALTREGGEFTLTGLPSGTQTLVVRQIGFAPVERPVELSARAPQRVTVTMSEPARVLETVEVRAKRDEGLERVGFLSRQKAKMGQFITTEDIENRNPQLLSDLFRSVPGLRVVQNGSDYSIQSTRGPGACVVYYVDGASWESLFPGDIDRLVPPSELAAVEVYGPGNTPAQFQKAGMSSCTSIVMWTRTRLRTPPPK